MLRNQADTEQMLTWSRVFIWEKRNLFSSLKMQPRIQLVCVSKLDVHQPVPAPCVRNILMCLYTRRTFVRVFLSSLVFYFVLFLLFYCHVNGLRPVLFCIF